MYTEEITNIIKEINPYIDINQDTELIDSGILDSLSIVFLITQIEDRFGVYVDEKLVVPENFKTLEKICEILGKCVKREQIYSILSDICKVIKDGRIHATEEVYLKCYYVNRRGKDYEIWEYILAKYLYKR